MGVVVVDECALASAGFDTDNGSHESDLEAKVQEKVDKVHLGMGTALLQSPEPSQSPAAIGQIGMTGSIAGWKGRTVHVRWVCWCC